MDSYAKKLIDRFWEERRLTYPHLSLLFDVVTELSEITPTSEEEKERWKRILSSLEIIQFQGNKFPIEVTEDLIHRNTSESLDQQISNSYGDCNLQELLLHTRKWIRTITRLCSVIATRYYYDMPRDMGEPGEKQILKEL